ncbi:MAG TPA: 1-deoxy-D-xylulose-5-phosphate reductoisomerase [Firmicutes bacterium]|nr:1-deoxy-D-xylulose-5-phosphate reductoisomerase [Bacillota bacterium]
MKKVVILGSTGSIGRQALKVIGKQAEKFQVVALTAQSNVELLEAQIRQYRPRYAALADEEKAAELREKVKDIKVTVLAGEKGLVDIASLPGYDVLLVSVVGFSGLVPTVEAMKQGKVIALANKETLVAGGALIVDLARKHGSRIVPVDSEHSAIFQCLQGQDIRKVSRLFLTASGGPFRTATSKEMEEVTPEMALKHPKWKMGPKITIDSATLMNKGLEVIEARWLFDIEYQSIEVIVHPQSIIHSMVEFVDGSVLAQLGVPDMALPIQYALSYPDRWSAPGERLDLIKNSPLTFEFPDTGKFPCLSLAYAAGSIGGTMPAAMNAANEAAVSAFLKGKLAFKKIPVIIDRVISCHDAIKNYTVRDILDTDNWARQKAAIFIEREG